jgi:hypothetical protein
MEGALTDAAAAGRPLGPAHPAVEVSYVACRIRVGQTGDRDRGGPCGRGGGCDDDLLVARVTDREGSPLDRSDRFFRTSFVVARVISVCGTTIDCAQANACAIAVANFPSLSSDAATLISFNAAIAPLEVTLSVLSISPIAPNGLVWVCGPASPDRLIFPRLPGLGGRRSRPSSQVCLS